MAVEDDSAVFIEQARWLIEQHNARSEAFKTRAVGLLGFQGVILALLLQGTGLDAVSAGPLTWVLLITVVVLLLLSCGASLWTVQPSEVRLPGTAQLRHWWQGHVARPQTGLSAPNIAESLLNSSDLGAPCPVTDAREEAATRSRRFRVALWLLLVGLLFMALLLFNVLQSI